MTTEAPHDERYSKIVCPKCNADANEHQGREVYVPYGGGYHISCSIGVAWPEWHVQPIHGVIDGEIHLESGNGTIEGGEIEDEVVGGFKGDRFMCLVCGHQWPLPPWHSNAPQEWK